MCFSIAFNGYEFSEPKLPVHWWDPRLGKCHINSYISIIINPCHNIFAKKNNPIQQPSSCSSHPNRFTSPQLLDHSNQRRRFFEAPRRLRRHRRWNGPGGRGGRVVEAGGWTVPAAPWGARVIHGKLQWLGDEFFREFSYR